MLYAERSQLNHLVGVKCIYQTERQFKIIIPYYLHTGGWQTQRQQLLMLRCKISYSKFKST